MAGITLDPKQARIVHALTGPVFVSAGAGAGKTLVLTQRVLYALTPGSKPREQWTDPDVPEPFLDSIDQVLAITFTTKAAQELKQRVRRALTEEGLDAQAERVEDAWFSTIHGMCSRIIRAYALDLDVDPGFTVADYADGIKREAVEHVLRDAGSEYQTLLSRFKIESDSAGSLSVNSLMGIMSAILNKVSSSTSGLDAFEQVTPKPSHRRVYEAYRAIAETPAFKNAALAQEAVTALDTYLASPRDMASLRACFAACDKLNKVGATSAEKEFVDEARSSRAQFFAEAYLAANSDALDELMPLAAKVQAEFKRLKHERNVLDNDDLLTIAYDALKNNPVVRAEFAGKFKMVMVDEFQDTAQQQVELVSLLCSPDGRELCTVGDAQQSIYRFRGADVSVFRNKASEVAATGSVLDLDVNFRSHAQILEFADRIFQGGEENRLGRDFLHLESCGEQTRAAALAKKGGVHAMRSADISRRQAVLVVGGTTEERSQVKAAAIAERFRRLRDEEGFAPGDMVIIMAKMSDADTYARAVREAGMPCVISGGASVFARAPEVAIVRSLVAFLADPEDGEAGIAPLITSPMFEFGASELLALGTCWNAEAGIVDTRTVTGDVLLRGTILEDFLPLPLLDRARAILGRALVRVGRDRMSDIARDVLNESGWLARLERGGAQDHAVAANVLKALSIIEKEEEGREYAPRLVAQAFADHIAHVKETPATLSGDGEDAVHIMTIHASKGLEYPVVAVVDSDGIRSNSDCFAMIDEGGRTLWTARPNLPELEDDASMFTAKEIVLEEGTSSVPPTASEALLYMREVSRDLDYEEAARKLYVAITRAREVVILAMGASSATELEPGHATSLVGEVLARILPADMDNSGLPDLGSDRLDFDDAHAGDYQMVLLSDLKYPSKSTGKKRPQLAFNAEDYPLSWDANAQDGSSEEEEVAGVAAEREVLLVEPAHIEPMVQPTAPTKRDSYSYSSMAAELHAEGEDRRPAAAVGGAEDASEDETAASANAKRAAPLSAATSAEDPTALGSAFHAAAQWLIETGAESVPAERVEAFARLWKVSVRQRERLDVALARWEGSAVRAEMRAWPCVRAEVPFFSLGMEEAAERFGAYAEGAIDVLCSDPARPGAALVLDYKTGGSASETPNQLQEKHALQAKVYADVLHKAGFEHVTLKFVRVEVADPSVPGEPQVVTYEL